MCIMDPPNRLKFFSSEFQAVGAKMHFLIFSELLIGQKIAFYINYLNQIHDLTSVPIVPLMQLYFHLKRLQSTAVSTDVLLRLTLVHMCLLLSKYDDTLPKIKLANKAKKANDLSIFKMLWQVFKSYCSY